MRPHAEAVLPVIALLAFLPLACRQPEERRIVAEEEILRRQIYGLKELVALGEMGSLVPEDKLVVSIAESLVQQVVELGLPREVKIQDKVLVRATGAEVRFRDNLASVRLDALVRPLDATAPDVTVEIKVYGALDRVSLDRASGTLKGKVAVLAFEVPRVQSMGPDQALRDLIERLGRDNLDAFSALAPAIEIPVHIEQDIVMKGPDRVASISVLPAQVPLEASVTRVFAAGEQLVVILDVQAGPWKKLPAAGRR